MPDVAVRRLAHARKGALAAAGFIALYTLGFLHGRTAGSPAATLPHCACSRYLSVRSNLNPSEVRELASCVVDHTPARVKHAPTRGLLHARLSRCMGRSSWRAPSPTTESSASSWDFPGWDRSEADGESSPIEDEAADDRGDAESTLRSALDEGEQVDQGFGEGEALDSTGLSSRLWLAADNMSADERAAKMMDAIREHEGMQEEVAADFSKTGEDAVPAKVDALSNAVRNASASAGGGNGGNGRSKRSSSSSASSDASSGASSRNDSGASSRNSSSSARSSARSRNNTSHHHPQPSTTAALAPPAVTPPAAAAAAVSAGAVSAAATAAPAAGATGAAAAPPKRVITYSLYGKTPKYVLGAVRNAERISTVFPGWTARFYIDMGTVPSEVVSALQKTGAELVPIDMARHGSQSMFWRFWAAADPTVERFISRDVDSRLMVSEQVS